MMPERVCPRCRYDLSGHESEVPGELRCPECGRTCTPAEAHAAARAPRERAEHWSRESLIGGSVGVVLAASFLVLARHLAAPAANASALAVWALSTLAGCWACASIARRRGQRGTRALFAICLMLAWIAMSHAVVVLIAVLVGAANAL